MKDQNYGNHIFYYIPHHVVFYPVIFLLTGVSVWYAIHNPDRAIEFELIAALFIMLGWLSYMLRQHYALGNQNRIIRLELRLRYFQLTGERFDSIEKQLSTTQMMAIRFASDEQFQMLIQETIDKGLSANSIKRSVQSWQPDNMRI